MTYEAAVIGVTLALEVLILGAAAVSDARRRRARRRGQLVLGPPPPPPWRLGPPVPEDDRMPARVDARVLSRRGETTPRSRRGPNVHTGVAVPRQRRPR